MLIIRGVIGGILLFLGRELNFIFAAGMAVLIGIRLTPLLPHRLHPRVGRVVQVNLVLPLGHHVEHGVRVSRRQLEAQIGGA